MDKAISAADANRRCAVGRLPGGHLRGTDVRIASGRQPAARGGTAGAGDYFTRRVRSAGLDPGAQSGPVPRSAGETSGEEAELSAIRQRTVHSPPGKGVRSDVVFAEHGLVIPGIQDAQVFRKLTDRPDLSSAANWMRKE